MELPQKYPDKESLHKVNLSWIWSEYNHKRKPFDSTGKEILTYINKYLNIDELIDY
jgi:hypothetical protein